LTCVTVVVSVVFLILNICSPAVSIADNHDFLKAAGCKTEYFLLYYLADGYKKNTGNKIMLGKTGNKKAVRLLMDNRIDFAFTCETIGQLANKLKLDKNIVSSWKSIPIALDPIVVVSNVNNGVQSITTAQLTDIFQGKVENWKEVGGNDLPIHTSYMNPEFESGVVELFKEFMGGDARLDENAQITDGPSISGNFVYITPGGVTFMGYNSYRVKYGHILKVDGIAPTRENILKGLYSLSATYYLTIDGHEREDVSQFVAFSLSEEGRRITEVNFIPYSE